MHKIDALRRTRIGLERRFAVLTAVLMTATLVANMAPRLPTMVADNDVPDARLENIALPAAPPPPMTAKTASSLLAASTSKLHDVFKHLGYDLDHVREHGWVPRVFLAALPPDMPKIVDTDERKRVFIKMVLPLVLHVNEMISHDRERILALQQEFKREKTLSIADGTWLRSMATGYGLGEDADFDELLLRVDVIPASLAVAQAAVESGWGTSRYAHEGRALFGQYLFKDGDGLVPRDREEGKTHKVRSFESLIDAVKAYTANLNTNAAYEGFRKSRAKMRAKNLDPDGYDLAEQLVKYSELRESYVKSLRRIIDSNELGRFDDVRLSSRLAL
jgi:Bax protein